MTRQIVRNRHPAHETVLAWLLLRRSALLVWLLLRRSAFGTRVTRWELLRLAPPQRSAPSVPVLTKPVASAPVFTATLLALASAFIHAAWNLIVKTSGDRQSAGWGVFACGGLLALPVLLLVGLPGWAALPWLALSAGVHLLYLDGLTGAYTHGDFSLSYPMARGGGAVLAAVGGVALLGDDFSGIAWAAVGIVALGLMSLRGRGKASGLGWALFTACCIGTYTLIDAHGARGAASGAAYGLALIPLSGLVITVVNLARGRGPDLAAAWPENRWKWMVGGACTATAYTLVLIAVRMAPVGYVTMLRESSVIIGAAAGWLVLREALGPRRVMSSAVILAGLVLLVATNA